MQGKIALEEHFAIPDTLMDSAGFVPDSYWPELKDRLLDIQDKRLAQMDRHGVEMMILSLNAPAVQAIPDIARANDIAVRANDFLAEQVAKRPSRFQAFAALPMQDPDLAINELERCIKDLGFVSCNVNPDVAGGKEPLTPSVGSEWWYPLWEKMVALDVPCTIHASASLNPAMHLTNAYYIAHHNSAAVELLKSRVFKDFPKLKIIIPHGGGAIPFQWNRQRGMHVREGLEPFEEAARRVYWDMAIYDKESMELLIKHIGADNVLFATEMFGAVNAIDPKTGRNFEDLVPIFQSIDWLSDEERYKITEGNARKVFSRMFAQSKI